MKFLIFLVLFASFCFADNEYLLQQYKKAKNQKDSLNTLINIFAAETSAIDQKYYSETQNRYMGSGRNSDDTLLFAKIEIKNKINECKQKMDEINNTIIGLNLSIKPYNNGIYNAGKSLKKAGVLQAVGLSIMSIGMVTLVTSDNPNPTFTISTSIIGLIFNVISISCTIEAGETLKTTTGLGKN